MLRQTQVPVLDGSQCSASGAVQRLAAVLPGLDESTLLCAGGQRSVDACHVSVGYRLSATRAFRCCMVPAACGEYEKECV